MSRAIKFRVYSNNYKKYLDTSGEGIFCEVHHLALKPNGKIYYADIGIEYPGTLSECPTLEWEEDYDDCVVEQYTGLKDKNGKEIYEGDIIQETIAEDGITDGTYTYEVYWDEDLLTWSLHGIDDIYHMRNDLWETNTSRKVIGNIHENGDLLK